MGDQFVLLFLSGFHDWVFSFFFFFFHALVSSRSESRCREKVFLAQLRQFDTFGLQKHIPSGRWAWVCGSWGKKTFRAFYFLDFYYFFFSVFLSFFLSKVLTVGRIMRRHFDR